MTASSHTALPAGFALHAFEALTPALLYEVLGLRQRVFIVEQACAFLDADGRDASALHLVHTGDGVVDAYLRIFLPTAPGAPASFGRVITAPEVRGTGLGHRLVDVALALIAERAPGAEVHIAAQAHLDQWYARHGFVVASEPYLEDDIVHVDMVRAPGAPTVRGSTV